MELNPLYSPYVTKEEELNVEGFNGSHTGYKKSGHSHESNKSIHFFFSLFKRCSKENTYGKPTVKKQGCFGSGTRIYFSQLLQRDKATLFYFFGLGLKHSFFNF